MNYTQILGEYAANLTFDKLPKEVVEQVKLITLHTIAVSVASRDTTTTSGARELAEAKGGSAEATIWGGSRKKVPADEAAYVNGTAADALDWEDCTWTGHASAGAIPAGFAMAEKLGASGRQYIEPSPPLTRHTSGSPCRCSRNWRTRSKIPAKAEAGAL